MSWQHKAGSGEGWTNTEPWDGYTVEQDKRKREDGCPGNSGEEPCVQVGSMRLKGGVWKLLQQSTSSGVQ